jgi:hypothetical protein
MKNGNQHDTREEWETMIDDDFEVMLKRVWIVVFLLGVVVIGAMIMWYGRP